MSEETPAVFQKEVVESLLRALEAKDPITCGHSHRCHQWVRPMITAAGLPESLIEPVELGAILHDIGKIGIPDAILQKPGALTPGEYTIVKEHPRIGYRILQPISFLNTAAAVVLYHQEWFNGKGYPDRLAGNKIPLGARLVAVADAWDAMTYDRVYRKALSREKALQELKEGAGTQFDPQMVEAFLSVIEPKKKEKEIDGLERIEYKPDA